MVFLGGNVPDWYFLGEMFQQCGIFRGKCSDSVIFFGGNVPTVWYFLGKMCRQWYFWENVLSVVFFRGIMFQQCGII